MASLSDDSDSDYDDIPILKRRRAGGSTGGNGKTRTNGSVETVGVESPTATGDKLTRRRSSDGTKKRVNVKVENDSDGESDFEPRKSTTKKKKKPNNKNGNNKNGNNGTKKKIKKESNNDFEPKPKKRRTIKTEQKTASSKTKELKKLDKLERLSHAVQSFLWWDAPEPPEGCQWTTMEHAGVSFTAPYKPHGVKMLYDGQPVDLSPAEEEAATLFASVDPNGMHLSDPKKASIFTKNFFTDFLKVVHKKHGIRTFENCDFEPIRRHLNEQKIIKKAITDDQRKANKAERNEVLFQFGYALVDGHIEKVGNINMEPPSAFRGRGEHPKMGKLKTRVYPEQVSVNVSECSGIPPCAVPGHAWGELRHDPQVQWLCQWKENINNQVKYMQLAAQSTFKGKSDMSKYNKAGTLCDKIDDIRADYKKKLKAKSLEERQLATAMWVIDRLALRVGGEKNTEEEADTVGCCSLRVEHFEFDPNGEGDDCKEIKLEFLGKDSMPYLQTIDFGDAMYTENNGMGEQVFANFKRFCNNKTPKDEVFNLLTPTLLNAHLKKIMDGLTAKMFRTYNASKVLQDELRKTEQEANWAKLSPTDKVVEYNNANRQVAILCNHQRSVSQAQETQLETIVGKIDTLKKQKMKLKKILKLVSSGDTDKIPIKKNESKMIEGVNKALAKAKKMKDSATTKDEKIAATEADEKAKQMKREITTYKFTQAHLWDKIPSAEQVSKKIQTWTNKIAKMEMDHKHKDDNKEVSLTTSKINYMDPRISVAWCKRNEVPIEKVFSKTLRDKFNWAMAVPPDWEFNAKIGKPVKKEETE